jgi:hypothetical protein
MKMMTSLLFCFVFSAKAYDIGYFTTSGSKSELLMIDPMANERRSITNDVSRTQKPIFIDKNTVIFGRYSPDDGSRLFITILNDSIKAFVEKLIDDNGARFPILLNNNQVVYSKGSKDCSSLLIKDLDNLKAAPEVLINCDKAELKPEIISSDGRYLLYGRWSSFNEPALYALKITKTNENILLGRYWFTSYYSDSVIALSGNRIAFISEEENDDFVTITAISFVDLNNSRNVAKVTDVGVFTSLAKVPGTDSIVFPTNDRSNNCASFNKINFNDLSLAQEEVYSYCDKGLPFRTSYISEGFSINEDQEIIYSLRQSLSLCKETTIWSLDMVSKDRKEITSCSSESFVSSPMWIQ